MIFSIRLIILTKRQDILKKKLEHTKLYLLYSLVIFNVCSIGHFGLNMEFNRYVFSMTPLISKIQFSNVCVIFFYYAFQRVLKGNEHKAKWLKIVLLIFIAQLSLCFAYMIYNIYLLYINVKKEYTLVK